VRARTGQALTPFFFEDSAEVAALFDRNAIYYDWVNSVICAGQDAVWRRWAARRALAAARDVAAGTRPPRILDACGGTGLVALELARHGAQVTLADGSEGMLAVAGERLERAGLAVKLAKVDLTADDGLPGAPYDAITVAFGLRYFEDPAALLRRLAAAIRPGGVMVILESVVPPAGLLASAAGAYFFHVAPRVGALLARRTELYEQLTQTTRDFGSARELFAHLRAAGLEPVAGRAFVFGVVVGLVARPGLGAPTSVHATEVASGRVFPPV
jgi:demethylmenaquinone methyltransferase / 2-methoxy-6-polyprenyl-1,4-benzoquinol methylase